MNVPTVPGDVLVGAAAASWGASGTAAGMLIDRPLTILAACAASVGIYMFGLADNDIVGAATDGSDRPIPSGEISIGAARIARGLCIFSAMLAGIAAGLPHHWWIAAFLLTVTCAVYNRTKWWLAMGFCRGLNVACGGMVAIASVACGFKSCSGLVIVILLWTAYVGFVTKFSEGEEKDPSRRRRVGIMIGALVYIQLVALLLFHLLRPSLALRNMLLAGAGLLLALRILKRTFPKVSAS